MLFSPYSKSRLDRAMCPWSFAQDYIRSLMKVKPEEVKHLKFNLVMEPDAFKLNLMFGSAVHDIFEKLLQDPTYDYVKSVPREIMISEHPMYNWSIIPEIVTRFMRKYSDVSDIYGVEELLAVDEDCKPCDYNDPRAMVRGKIDLLKMDPIRGTASITDYKTQANIVEAKDHIQTKIYAWLLWKNFPQLESVSADLYFARWGATRSATYTRDELDWVENFLKVKIDEVETRTDFTEAKRCGFCGLCEYASTYCPLILTEKSYLIKPILTNEDAVEALSQKTGIEIQSKVLDKNLQQWVEKEGNVYLDDTEIGAGYKTQNSVKFDMGKLIELAKADRIDMGTCFQPNLKQMDKFIRQLEGEAQHDERAREILEDVKEARTEEIKTVFGIVKKSKVEKDTSEQKPLLKM